MRLPGLPVLSIITLLASWPVCAHHSSAIFDKETEVEFTGTVTAFKWANPHVYIEVESDGVTWLVEGMAPGAMPLQRTPVSSASVEVIIASPALAMQYTG